MFCKPCSVLTYLCGGQPRTVSRNHLSTNHSHVICPCFGLIP